jgi:hypothetical protein
MLSRVRGRLPAPRHETTEIAVDSPGASPNGFVAILSGLADCGWTHTDEKARNSALVLSHCLSIPAAAGTGSIQSFRHGWQIFKSTTRAAPAVESAGWNQVGWCNSIFQ